MRNKLRLLTLVVVALLPDAAIRAASPALTIYNRNFAVVRETMPLELRAGVSEAAFSGVTTQLEADSVILRDPTGKATWQILEQSYRSEVASQSSLLAIFEGQTIDFLQAEEGKPDHIVRGKILRAPESGGENSLIEVDGKLRFELPGVPLFPSLGDDTILKPRLAWKIRATAPVKLDAELSYLTQGLTWEASYNLIQVGDSPTVDLVGWVSIANTSGTTFADAGVKLMAGEVNKANRPKEHFAARVAADAQSTVSERPFDEFHLYTLPQPLTLRNGETKLVEFVRAAGIKAERIYVYDGGRLEDLRSGGLPKEFAEMSDLWQSMHVANPKVGVYREFQNTKDNRLGLPLPAGGMRFYRQNAEAGQVPGAPEFVGENELDHMPKDERIRLYIGNAFDLVGERRATDFQIDHAGHHAEESFEIELRNHKEQPVDVRVVEHLYRWSRWEIVKPSSPFEKKDAQTVEFRVPVPAGGKQVVRYTVTYSW